MKAALARAAGYIAPNTHEVEAERPAPDAEAIRAELLANSLRFFAEDAADAQFLARIEKILSDTQGRRGSRPNPVYFLDCSDLCYIGK